MFIDLHTKWARFSFYLNQVINNNLTWINGKIRKLHKDKLGKVKLTQKSIEIKILDFREVSAFLV